MITVGILFHLVLSSLVGQMPETTESSVLKNLKYLSPKMMRI